MGSYRKEVLNMIKNVISVIDGEAGSCGKAKVIGEITTDPSINLGCAITNCMPNAGHTYVDEKGEKTIFRNIPVSCVNPKTELFIGPGSEIDMKVFREEYSHAKKYLGDRKIYVHEMVPLIENRHKKEEQRRIKSGSTFKGCAPAMCDKIMRDQKLKFFKTFKNAVLCSNAEWLERVYEHLDDPFEYCILEGAQGCDLSINHSGNWPHTTSRNISTAQMLADSGISPKRLLETIMVIRPFPIRINNITKNGDYIYTGKVGKGEELYWSLVNIASQYGTYPYHGMLEDMFPSMLTPKLTKHLLTRCPEIYLKQVLGPNYRARSIDSITTLEALELERLVAKSHGQDSYVTRIVDLGPVRDFDKFPNEIEDLSETTTVTQMERRIGDIDIDALKRNVKINDTDFLYLNFFQHICYEYMGSTGNFDDYMLDLPYKRYIDWLESETEVPICALGTGPRNNEKIMKMKMVKEIERT